LTLQEFCPFAVPAPQFHFVGKPLFAEGESSTWDLATLKDRLLSIATLYLECSQGMQAGPWYPRIGWQTCGEIVPGLVAG
jgi:hypothetical protein